MTILIREPYFNFIIFWVECFKKTWFVVEISNKLSNGLFGTNLYKTLESCWQSSLKISQWSNTTSVISRCDTFSPFLSLVIFLFYFQCFQAILLFQYNESFKVFSKFKAIPIFNFKCNPIFNIIYIYLYWWFISIFSMLF